MLDYLTVEVTKVSTVPSIRYLYISWITFASGADGSRPELKLSAAGCRLMSFTTEKEIDQPRVKEY